MESPTPIPERSPDWEAFYRNYRKPGYVSGFEITSKLGGGMFGLVFKATRQSIGKDYAIKFLKVDDAEVRRAVLLELEQVQYFAQIDHPNLVSIEDRGEVDGIPYLVMAYAGAETLRDRLPGRRAADGAPLDRAELLGLFLQACRGTAALHERSLVHFDLKPANVFLKGGVARVGDYGLSKLVTHSRGSLSMGRGTPYYMAPEMLQRRGDRRSDVYSLGVMLYEILCGDVPFQGGSEWEVLRKHESARLPAPACLGLCERAVIERCMAKDPARRFQRVDELVVALSPLVAGVPGGGWLAAPAAGRGLAVPPPLPQAGVQVQGLQGSPPLPAAPVPAAAAARPRPRRAGQRQAQAGAAEFVATAWEPPPLPRRRGRAWPAWMALAMLVACAVFLQSKVHSLGSHRSTRSHRTVSAPRVVVVDHERSEANRLREEIRELATELDRAARRAPRHVPGPFDGERVAVPADLPLYGYEIESFCRTAPVFSAASAERLSRLGFPIVLAAVHWLQDLDYRSRECCRRAALVLQFLQHATSVRGLVVEAPGGMPGRSDTRRFEAAAGAWRRLVERFCPDADRFEVFLQHTGKVVARGRGN